MKSKRNKEGATLPKVKDPGVDISSNNDINPTNIPNLNSDKLQELFSKQMQDRKWRLNHLYYIKNEEGKEVQFHLNETQEHLFKNLWYLNIILKARQLGVTTFFSILDLDDVLFKGLDAGLIAHTLGDAIKIFDTKVKYAWDRIPDFIKEGFKVSSENVRELKFKNKATGVTSSIYVGTSLRSGTVQRLHISELSTLDQKYPAKSNEIRSGALNTVHRGQVVTIESTAKGPSGNFFDIFSVADEQRKMKRNLTDMDYKTFFFPWYLSKEYQIAENIVLPKDIQEYFKKMEVETGYKFSRAQMNWYFKKKNQQGEDMKSEFPTTAKEAFAANIEGAYFGKQMDRVMEDGRITKVAWEPLYPVDTWWDLGTSKQRKDATSIVFTQSIGQEVRIIDFYGNCGEGLLHYKKYLDDKPYAYGTHNGPHDLMVTELGTGKTRIEMASNLGLNFNIVPNIGFSDGIEATRVILNKCWFDEENTDELIKALKSFRKQWDDNRGRFKDTPLKDWASDPADAFRMMAVGSRANTSIDEEEYHEETNVSPFNPFI